MLGDGTAMDKAPDDVGSGGDTCVAEGQGDADVVGVSDAEGDAEGDGEGDAEGEADADAAGAIAQCHNVSPELLH